MRRCLITLFDLRVMHKKKKTKKEKKDFVISLNAFAQQPTYISIMMHFVQVVVRIHSFAFKQTKKKSFVQIDNCVQNELNVVLQNIILR